MSYSTRRGILRVEDGSLRKSSSTQVLEENIRNLEGTRIAEPFFKPPSLSLYPLIEGRSAFFVGLQDNT
jgi:hypothetical protein